MSMSHESLTYRNFFLSAPTREALQLQLLDLQLKLSKKSDLVEIEASRGSIDVDDSHVCRAGIIYSDAPSFNSALSSGLKRLEKGQRPYFKTKQGFYYHCAELGRSPGKLAFLYPGFGSEYAGMGAGLEDFSKVIDEWFCYVEPAMKSWFFESNETNTLSANKRLGEYGQSGHLLAMALTGLLKQQGINPDVIGGHSNGENSALYAAGVARCENRAHELQVMAEITEASHVDDCDREVGAFIIVGQMSCGELEVLIEEFGGEVVIAMENCANQFVLFASAGISVAVVVEQVVAARGIAFPLASSLGFHTKFFKSRESMVNTTYAHLDFGAGHTPLYSCISAELFSEDHDAIVQMARRQWFERVRFREMIERMYADGVRIFIEVGPNNRLCGFVNDILRGRGCLVVASNLPDKTGCEQIGHLLAQCFVFGLKVNGLSTSADAVRQVDKKSIIPPNLSSMPQFKSLLSVELGPAARAELMIRHEALMRRYLKSEGVVTQLMMQRLGGRSIAQTDDSLAQASGASQQSVVMPFVGEDYTISEGSLSARRVLSREKDHFIFDHIFGKSTDIGDYGPLPVLPFAISVEIAAEATSLLKGKHWGQFELLDVRGVDWVILREAEQVIHISAQVVDEVTTRVELSQCTGGASPAAFWSGHFVELATTFDDLEPVPRLEIDRTRLRKPVISARNYYNDVLFHGPMFQGITEISGVSEEGLEGMLEMPDFSNAVLGCDSSLCLSSPSLADCVGQLAAFWALECMDDQELAAFPFKIEQTRYLQPTPAAGSLMRCVGKIRVIGQSILEADFDYYTSDGSLYAQYRGFSQRFYRNRYIPRMIYQQPHEVHFSDPIDAGENPSVLSRVIDNEAIAFLAGSRGFWANVLGYLVLSPQERNEWLDQTRQSVEMDAIRWLIEITLVKDIYREWYRQKYGRHISLSKLIVYRRLRMEFEVYPVDQVEHAIRVQLQDSASRLEGVWHSDVNSRHMVPLLD